MDRLRIIALLGFVFLGSELHAQDWNKVFVYEQDADYFMIDKQFEKAADSYIKALRLTQ